MKICFIAHTNSPWALPYSSFLHARGHEVHVITFHPQTLPDVTVHYVGSDKRDGSLPKALYIQRIPRIRQLLQRLKPDVVMATYTKSNGLIGALTKCSALIVSTRGVDYTYGLPFGLNDALIRWIAGRAELLHASSRELVEDFSDIGIAPERFTVIPMGVDSNAFAPSTAERADGPPRIICTRRHLPIYDNATIVKAAAMLRDRGMHFEMRFVGQFSRDGAAFKAATELGLHGALTFIDEAAPGEIADHLRWADIYVSASRSDGAPSSLFEALSVRLFPVLSDIRANRDWLEHGRDAYLFPFGDAALCARYLETAWQEKDLRELAIDRNRRLVVEQLDRNTGLEKLEKMLIRAAEQYRTATS